MPSDRPLVVLAVGKLTNVALALKRAPEIARHIRIVWLGSNFPEPGEYNQVNEPSSLRYILSQNVPFEMVTVRYGKPSGTDAVRVTADEINIMISGLGPTVSPAITGRHGGNFTTFGDYSVNLFSHVELYGSPPSRALFDMVAVAILKKPAWATATTIDAPALKKDQWTLRPNNDCKITLWENFNSKVIKTDFYQSLKNYTLVRPKG